MVPVADMLNHYRPRETSWTFDNAQQCFTMTALTPLKKGQQVMDSYGKKCNSKFLLHYGFAIESNREADGTCLNQLPVTLSLDPADPLYMRKVQLVKSEARYKVAMCRSIGQTNRALQYLRTVIATKGACFKYTTRTTVITLRAHPVSQFDSLLPSPNEHLRLNSGNRHWNDGGRRLCLERGARARRDGARDARGAVRLRALYRRG